MNAKELKKRTKGVAHRSVKLAITLPKTELGVHIRKQLIRCATSVAANYRATLHAGSIMLIEPKRFGSGYKPKPASFCDETKLCLILHMIASI